MNAALLAIQAQAVELGADVTETTEKTENSGILSPPIFSVASGVSANSALSALSVTPKDEQIIQETLPADPHERMSSLVNLARGLRFNCGLGETPLPELKPIVRHWHELALPHIDPADGTFDRTWEDFVNAWPRVRLALGDGLSTALARARQRLTGGAVERYDSAEVRLVVSLCRELSDTEGRFFLGSHGAAKMMGLKSPMRLWRIMQMLQADGLVKATQKGTPGKDGRATRYRWLIDPK